MMSKLLKVMILAVLFSGCVAHVTPEGTYIEPLPSTIIVGPPVVETPPPGLVVSPLPPVFLVPDRHLYQYRNMYYNYWGGEWYYGKRDRGPWYRLPKEYYPKNYKHRDGDSDRDRGRDRDRDRGGDRYRD
jgi:hypothetical protein